MIDQDLITEQQPKKVNRKALLLLLSLVVILGLLVINYVRQQKEAYIQQQLVVAQGLINQGKLQEAITVLNDVLNKDPKRLKAYEFRSTAYFQSRSNNYTEQQNYFVNSIHDLDKVIELDPTNGNHYVDRDVVLRALADLPPDSTTKFAIYEIANENVGKAM